MSAEDHELLMSVLAKKPQRILEVGVSAGGTTKLLLENMGPEATLVSVDLARQYYRDQTKEVGFIAEFFFKNDKRWTKLLGRDISFVIDNFIEPFDFVVLDTAHILPGEVLSFLVILPYMADGSVMQIHRLPRCRCVRGRPGSHHAESLLFFTMAFKRRL